MSDALDAGNVSGVADTLIAGTVREAGATLVTTDNHFEPIPNLSVRLVERESD